MKKFLSDRWSYDVMDNAQGEYLHDAVAHGLTPFKPRRIDLYVDFDIDYNQYRVCAEAIFVGMNPVIAFIERVDAGDLHSKPLDTLYKIGDNLATAFRFRETIPNIDGHHLGEE